MTLYKTNKNGSIQQWSISVSEDTYTVEFGQVGGAMQTQSTTCEEKNIGRANETTPAQQAQLEANALISKKMKSGYSTNPEAPQTVSLPMKVKAYQDQMQNVKFPCFSSAKLDGVNAIYKRIDDRLTIYSRGGEVYSPIPHLESLVREAMNLFKSNELNGELYIHGEFLQDIQSAVKKPNKLSSKLSFCIFDIADSTQQFSERATLMHKYYNFDTTLNSTVAVIHNSICLSHAELDTHFNSCTTFGYEGTVVKNTSALYQHNVRSSDMFKYKKAQAAEFLIIGYELDKRKHPVFHLQTNTTPSTIFKAKPIGTHEFVSSIDPDSYVGKFATVEFETLSKSGVPLKPIFISLRECNELGEPLC